MQVISACKSIEQADTELFCKLKDRLLSSPVFADMDSAAPDVAVAMPTPTVEACLETYCIVSDPWFLTDVINSTLGVVETEHAIIFADPTYDFVVCMPVFPDALK